MAELYLIVLVDIYGSGCIELSSLQTFHSFFYLHCLFPALGSEHIHFNAKVAQTLQV